MSETKTERGRLKQLKSGLRGHYTYAGNHNSSAFQ